MKFILVFYDLSKKAGIQKALVDFATELSDIGYNVEILIGPNKIDKYFTIRDKININQHAIIEQNSQKYLLNIVYKIIYLIKIIIYLLKFNFNKNNIIIDFGTSFGLLWPFKYFFKSKVYLYRHFPIDLNPLLFKFYGNVFRKKCIIVLNLRYKNALNNLRFKNILVLPNTYDARWCSVIPCDSKKRTLSQTKKIKILCVGRYSEQKNQRWLINLLNEYKEIPFECECNFYGDGDYNELQRLSSDKRNNKVQFNYHTSFPSPVQLIDTNTIVISPSIYEGQPIFLLESLSHGSILMCSNINAHIDIVGNNYYGLFDLNNQENFKNKLNYLAKMIIINTDLEYYYQIGKEITIPFSRVQYRKNVENLITDILQ